MFDRKLHYLLVCFLCLYLLQSYSYAQIEHKPEDLIHFGDIIDVDVVGSTEFDWRGTLNPEGYLNGIDFVNEPIFGLCKSEKEVGLALSKEYGKLLRDPQIVVRIIDRSGRPAAILYGAVKTPQRFLIKRRISLNELIILSGGITDKSSGEIQIIRPQNLSCGQESDSENPQNPSSGEPPENFVTVKKQNSAKSFKIKINDLLRGDKVSNPIILSGDIITVLEADPIYVIGGVANPKQINARSHMTVSRAVASVGGFSKDANPKNITIFRQVNNATQIINIDFEKIKSGQAEDIVLQKYDIVDVSQNGREKRKFPPVIRSNDIDERKISEIPLRIVD
jgi:polysaccharide export outer membrane protein